MNIFKQFLSFLKSLKQPDTPAIEDRMRLWSEKDEDYLLTYHLAGYTDEYIAKNLHRSVGAVYQRRLKLLKEH
mgnify:CR=1 FL=1